MSMSSSPNTAAPQPDPELPNQLEKECAIAFVVVSVLGGRALGEPSPTTRACDIAVITTAGWRWREHRSDPRHSPWLGR